MNLLIDINQLANEIAEEEKHLQVSVAEKILGYIDSHLMESGNDKVRIRNLLELRSRIRKGLKGEQGVYW